MFYLMYYDDENFKLHTLVALGLHTLVLLTVKFFRVMFPFTPGA